MKYTYLGVAAFLLLLQGCVPKPVFRMEPITKNTIFNQGTEYVHLIEGGVELSISYYRHMGKRFLMDVEIVNNTDSVLRVDPRQFGYDAYEYTSAIFPKESDKVMASRKAINPERELLEVDKALSRAEASQKTNTILYAATQGVAIAGAIAADTEEEREDWEETQEDLYINRQRNKEYRHFKKLHLQDRREVWEIDALRITDLYPGEYIRGYLFFKNEPDARGYLIRFDPGKAMFEIFYRQIKHQP